MESFHPGSTSLLLFVTHVFLISMSRGRKNEANILEICPSNFIKTDLPYFLSRKSRTQVLHLNSPWLPHSRAVNRLLSDWKSVTVPCAVTVAFYTLLIGHTVAL